MIPTFSGLQQCRAFIPNPWNAAVLALVFSLWLGGCKKAEPSAEEGGAGSPKPLKSQAELPKPEFFVTDEIAEQRKITQEMKELFNKRDFEALDKRAAELRKDKSSFANGVVRIRSFYKGVEKDDKAPDTEWEA